MQLSLFTVVPMILVLASASAESHLRGLQARKLCSGSGSGAQHGGDCSNTPTYCGSSGNTVSCSYQPPRSEEITNVCKDTCLAEFQEKNNDSTGGVPGPNRYTCNEEEMNNHPNWCAYKSCKWECPDDIVTPLPTPPNSDEARACYKPVKGCSSEVYEDFPDWCSSDYMERFGGYRGSCSGTNNCLNLDFHCGEYCELSCTGQNSCEGLTMHCADNQFCEIQNCGDGTERCVGAKVVCGEGTVAQGLRCEPTDRPNPEEPGGWCFRVLIDDYGAP